MTPEEARWLEKYFGPDLNVPIDSPDWIAGIGLEELLSKMVPRIRGEGPRGYLANVDEEDRLAADALLQNINRYSPQDW